MIEPAWFFSTLAQATAAAVGFVLAFAASQHSNQRNRYRERIQNTERDVEEFVKIYYNDIKEIYSHLLHKYDYDDPRFIEGDLYSKEFRDIINIWVEDQGNELKAYALANSYWAMRLMDDIEESAQAEDMLRYFDGLSYAINDLNRKPIGIPRETDNRLIAHRPFEFANEMKTQYDKIASKIYDLKNINRENRANEFISTSKQLFIAGVVIPISFLITVSSETPVLSKIRFEGVVLLGLQAVNLILVLYLSLKLFNELQQLIRPRFFLTRK